MMTAFMYSSHRATDQYFRRSKDLERTNSLFKRVFDSLEEPVLMFQDGHPIYANGMFLAKLGSLIS